MVGTAPEKSAEQKQVGPMRKRVLGVFLVLAAVALGLVVAEANRVTSLVPRVSDLVSYLTTPKDDHLTIVAVHASDKEENNFIRGARMAVEKVNTTGGGILGRRLDLQLVSEQPISDKTVLETTVEKTLKLAGQITRTENLLAVIGHEWSDSAIPASSIYNRNGILYLSTYATAKSLTNHGFNTIFALQPDNSTNAQLIASYALKQGVRRFVVLSDKTEYAKESANFFTAAVTEAGADLVFRGHLSSNRQSMENLLMFILDNKVFQRSDFDAFFIVSSSLDETADFIKSARSLGLDVPIFGMEYMFSETIEKMVGKKAMRDVAGVSLYDRDNISKRATNFVKNYTDAYGHIPDLNAALGYDAVMLIRDVADRAGTIDTKKMSDTLKIARYKTPFVGVTGPLIFNQSGQITDTQVFIVRHDGEAFRTVGSYGVPVSWDGIAKDSKQKNGDIGTSSTDAEQPLTMEKTGQ